MFTHEQRLTAVRLYIKYNHQYKRVYEELGYPTHSALSNWFKEFEKSGCLHEQRVKHPPRYKYTDEDRIRAIDYFLDHKGGICTTIKALGYPSYPVLKGWLISAGIDYRRASCVKKRMVLQSEKTAVQDASGSPRPSDTIRPSRSTKRHPVRKGAKMPYKQRLNTSESTTQDDVTRLKNEVERLSREADSLQKEVYHLQMQKDALEKATELIKKDQGISISSLTNREKAIVINALRERYPLKELLPVMQMAKSSYFYQVEASQQGKYKPLRDRVRNIFETSKQRYGYRRIHSVLKSDHIIVSEKVVRRIMREEHLAVPRTRKKKYCSYKGEISPSVPNIINRNFHSDMPNKKWVTDITEFLIPAGKVYLSPIIDCFDGMPVSWTIGTSPDAELVNAMLDKAILTLRDDEKPLVHSDRGCHYRWPGWINRMEKSGLVRSMSKKGCSPDNAACEGFFGRLKNEMFYGRSWLDVSIEQFISEIDQYMKWYAEKRIKLSLDGMSPLDYRKSKGLVVS